MANENVNAIKTGKEQKSFKEIASANSMWVILIVAVVLMSVMTLIKGGAFFLSYTNISNIFQSEVGPGLLALGDRKSVV